MNKKIIEIWNEVEDDFPAKSTEFLLAVTCDRYQQFYGREIDNGDVAAALAEHAGSDK
jgi:hypothetical protein